MGNVVAVCLYLYTRFDWSLDYTQGRSNWTGFESLVFKHVSRWSASREPTVRCAPP